MHVTQWIMVNGSLHLGSSVYRTLCRTIGQRWNSSSVKSPSPHTISPPCIPPPTPFVPDVRTFLGLIGRDTLEHLNRIPTWSDLFTWSSRKFRAAGIEPPRTRRYILRWRERFRRGNYGPGGDLHYLDPQGRAELRIFPLPVNLAPARANLSPRTRYIAVNVPPGTADSPIWSLHMYPATRFSSTLPSESSLPFPLTPVRYTQVRGSTVIHGPYVNPLKSHHGTAAYIQRSDGMWEIPRGRKIDGGERRRAEVRARRIAKMNSS